jgi:hypothetical protein
MAVRTSGQIGAAVCQFIVLIITASVVEGQPVGAEKREPSTFSSRILLSDRATARALKEAVPEAWRQLDEPRCQALLNEFTDQRGLTLAENIPKDAGSLQNYLARIVFVDGADTKSCARGALAVTKPGSRVVRVCGSRLVWTWQQNARHVVAGLIHEALHTLGLGENPPSSAEITSRVLARCGAK